LFLCVLALDYFQVLTQISENKRLKGENFKLRQDLQLIRNRVDSMESTIERVRNYARKLQLLTGDDKEDPELPMGPMEDGERRPTGDKEKSSRLTVPNENEDFDQKHSEKVSLDSRVELLQNTTVGVETRLSRLHSVLIARAAIVAATPSLLPIHGWISSPFGYRRHPYDGGYRLHAGVDIAADPGTPVRAPANGTVIFAGYREGYGKVVVIDHGYGIRTLFAHTARLYTSLGVRVRRGSVIAEVGSTGMATGPHLHYEVRKNGVPVNPITFFSRARF